MCKKENSDLTALVLILIKEEKIKDFVLTLMRPFCFQGKEMKHFGKKGLILCSIIF